jgi:hypothetical protein
VSLENLDRWDNNGSKGPNQYDWAIDGVPFLSASSKEYPYVRESVDVNKQQIDTAKEVGEQALGNWWYRSQSSFDLGANAFYTDTGKDDNISRRFYDSHGIDALEEIGQVTLQNKTSKNYSVTATNLKTVAFASGGKTGVLYADGTALRYYLTDGTTPAHPLNVINYGATETILDIDTDGSRYFVLTTKAVYADGILVADPQPIEKRKIISLERDEDGNNTDVSAGVIKFIKERLIIGIRKADKSFLYQSAIVPIGKEDFYQPIKIEWAEADASGGAGVRYIFAKSYNFNKNDTIKKVENSPEPAFNFDTPKIISSVDAAKKKFRIAGLPAPSNLANVDTGGNAKVYTSLANVPVTIYKTVASYWNWSSIADGPNGIYCAGYSGDRSAIMFATVSKEEADDAPEIQPPYVVAELPNGEIIYSMISYLSVYLIVGTNKGVRVAIIDSRGGLIMGPLTVKSDNDVKALAVSGDFCYAGGAVTKEVGGTDRVAMYKINLSKTVQENTLSFAYQKFIFADLLTATDSLNIGSITKINSIDKLVFTVTGNGLYTEGSDKVDSGWLETGKVRLDTAEDKIFQYLRVSNLPTDGFISVYWRDETNTLSTTPITAWYCEDYTGTIVGKETYLTDPTGIRAIDMEGTIPVDGVISAHPYISYRFVLEKGRLSNTNSPVLLSYQIKANPANIKQSLFRLPLLAMNREKAIGGMIVERPVFDRVRLIEKAEQEGKVVLFQDFGTGEERLVLVEKTQFISNHIPETKAGADRGGILLVTVRTIDPINTTGSLI